jgi:hypothetical protein
MEPRGVEEIKGDRVAGQIYRCGLRRIGKPCPGCGEVPRCRQRHCLERLGSFRHPRESSAESIRIAEQNPTLVEHVGRQDWVIEPPDEVVGFVE